MRIAVFGCGRTVAYLYANREYFVVNIQIFFGASRFSFFPRLLYRWFLNYINQLIFHSVFTNWTLFSIPKMQQSKEHILQIVICNFQIWRFNCHKHPCMHQRNSSFFLPCIGVGRYRATENIMLDLEFENPELDSATTLCFQLKHQELMISLNLW